MCCLLQSVFQTSGYSNTSKKDGNNVKFSVPHRKYPWLRPTTKTRNNIVFLVKQTNTTTTTKKKITEACVYDKTKYNLTIFLETKASMLSKSLLTSLASFSEIDECPGM